MGKPKKLTLSTLNKLDASLLNEKKVVYVIDGQYPCQVDKKFRRTKVQKLGLDYIDFLNQLKSQKDVNSDTIMSVPILLYALICKYFTDLPIQTESLEELVDRTQKLLDLGVIEQLFSGDIEKGFDPAEVEMLNKELEKISKGVGQVVGEMAYMSALDEVGEEDGEQGLHEPE